MMSLLLRKYLFILLCCCIGRTSCAQYDTSFNTTYYEQKLTQFRLIPVVNEDDEIIFLGDSITDIGEWAELLQNHKIKNRGISGDITYGVLNRLDEVIQRKPAKVFIMIGINDIANKIPDSIIVANYQKIIMGLQQSLPHAKIYIQSILPVNNAFTEFPRHQNKDEHITCINSSLKKLSAKANCIYIDLYSLMINKQGKLDEKYTNDGLHLKGEGYMVWKKEMISKKYCCSEK